MNIYKVKRTDAGGYDTFDSMIVAAKGPATALRIHPDDSWGDGRMVFNEKEGHWNDGNYSSWVNSLDDLIVEYLGEADEKIPGGVILASFNAG